MTETGGQVPPETWLATLGSLCEDIAAGRYTHVEALMSMTGDVRLPDAARRLAEAFGLMLVQVEAREFRLSGLVEELAAAKLRLQEKNLRLTDDNRALADEVARLRIRIDVLSRDREVAEIAQSDYFLELQARIGALRDRFRGGGR